MGRFTRSELEQAAERFRNTARQSATSHDWTPWANLLTEDATYREHHFGEFCGREAIYRWISSIMSPYPMNHMLYFPWTWWVIDEERGWVIAEIMNRMLDPGDGSLHQEPNITILHYAGDNLWRYEEDAYDWQNVVKMIERWQQAKEYCEKLVAQGRDPRAERHLGRIENVPSRP